MGGNDLIDPRDELRRVHARGDLLVEHDDVAASGSLLQERRELFRGGVGDLIESAEIDAVLLLAGDDGLGVDHGLPVGAEVENTCCISSASGEEFEEARAEGVGTDDAYGAHVVNAQVDQV